METGKASEQSEPMEPASPKPDTDNATQRETPEVVGGHGQGQRRTEARSAPSTSDGKLGGSGGGDETKATDPPKQRKAARVEKTMSTGMPEAVRIFLSAQERETAPARPSVCSQAGPKPIPGAEEGAEEANRGDSVTPRDSEAVSVDDNRKGKQPLAPDSGATAGTDEASLRDSVAPMDPAAEATKDAEKGERPQTPDARGEADADGASMGDPYSPVGVRRRNRTRISTRAPTARALGTPRPANKCASRKLQRRRNKPEVTLRKLPTKRWRR